jgi:hypothetical protein
MCILSEIPYSHGDSMSTFFWDIAPCSFVDAGDFADEGSKKHL